VGLVARTPRNLDPREAGWGPFLRMAVWLARAACPVQPPAPALVVRKLLALEELLPICSPGLPEPLGGQRAPGRRAHRWGWRRLDRSVRATARAGRLVRMLGKVVEPAVIAAGFCLLRAGSGAAVPTWGHGRRSDPHRWGGPQPGNGGRFDGWDRYECAVNTVWQDFSGWGLCLYNTAATPPWSSMPSSEPTPGSFPPPATAIPAAGMKASRRCRAWPPRRAPRTVRPSHRTHQQLPSPSPARPYPDRPCPPSPIRSWTTCCSALPRGSPTPRLYGDPPVTVRIWATPDRVVACRARPRPRPGQAAGRPDPARQQNRRRRTLGCGLPTSSTSTLRASTATTA
jgi:hypothetical protein